MYRKGRLPLQLKFGIIFAVAYIVLIAALFIAASSKIAGQGEHNAPAWILLIISGVIWYAFYRTGLGPVTGSSSTFFGGLFLTGLLVFGIGILVGHIITIIIRYKALRTACGSDM